jgi:ParB-like chromosome segregation protein Spo0J
MGGAANPAALPLWQGAVKVAIGVPVARQADPADKVERWAVSRLIPYARNARTHSDAQVAQIAASIKEWGWTTPVLVDEQGGIIAGHGRTMAANLLGMADVPVVVATGWSEAKKRAYVIADNKLALNAGWDNELLRLELGDIKGLGFDLSLTGFGLEELQDLQFDDDAEAPMPALPDGDKATFQQRTFTLHDEQAATVEDAIVLARTNPLADTGINDNANGNALAFICQEWLAVQSGQR